MRVAPRVAPCRMRVARPPITPLRAARAARSPGTMAADGKPPVLGPGRGTGVGRLDRCPTTVEDHAVIEQYSYCQLFQPPAAS
jgi:hypothetical protein